jgi:hypothetical protein
MHPARFCSATAWLRELIGAGLLSQGEVDERSIVDVRGDDLGAPVRLGARDYTALASGSRKLGQALADHIFLYVSAAITLAIVILSLLTPPPGRDRERQR